MSSDNRSIRFKTLFFCILLFTSCGNGSDNSTQKNPEGSLAKSIEYFSNNGTVSPEYYHENHATLSDHTINFTRTGFNNEKTGNQWTLSDDEIGRINERLSHIDETDTDILTDDIPCGASYSYMWINGITYINNGISDDPSDTKFHKYSGPVESLYATIAQIIWVHTDFLDHGTHGDYSSYTLYGGVEIEETTLIVIKSQADFNTFWKLHTSNLYPVMPTPLVDFDKKMVLVIMCPVFGGGGYDIKIDDIYNDGAGLVVSATLSSPGPNCITTTTLTQPYSIMPVDSSNLPVILNLTKNTVNCH